MFWKPIDLATNASSAGSTDSPSRDYKIALPVRATDIRGWYRFKVVSPKRVLANISIQAFEIGRPSQPFFSLTSRPAKERFTGYLYISSQIELVEILVSVIPGQTDDLAITLRPITLVE